MPEEGRPSVVPEDELERLRGLLVGPERDGIQALQERLDQDPLLAADVSRVLPESVKRSARSTDRLAHSMQPLVEESLRISVARDPGPLVAVLSPAMGPAIRRAIARGLRDVMSSLERILEHSLSLRSWSWRVEAWRSGRPFAEVAMSHLLRYRVERVFLIHTETGLLLQHVAVPELKSGEEDMVAGMLTAIQDFVHRSFASGQEDATDLNMVEVGELTVLVERGPEAMLAAVVRGTPEGKVRECLEQVTARIHGNHATELSEFDGDITPFDATAEDLEDCLLTELLPRSPVARWAARAIPVFLLLGFALLLAWLGVLGLRAWTERADVLAFAGRLDDEPGILVTGTSRESGRYRVSGLRAPSARDPEGIAREAGYSPDELMLAFEPTLGGQGAFDIVRARGLLAVPKDVTIHLDDTGRLVAEGAASRRWLSQAEILARTLDGVTAVDFQAVEDLDLSAIREAWGKVDGTAFRFAAPGAAVLTGGERLRLMEAALDVQALRASARTLGRTVLVEVVGHADVIGSVEENARVSMARALHVRDVLSGQGVPPSLLVLRTSGSLESSSDSSGAEAREEGRRVTVQVLGEKP